MDIKSSVSQETRESLPKLKKYLTSQKSLASLTALHQSEIKSCIKKKNLNHKPQPVPLPSPPPKKKFSHQLLKELPYPGDSICHTILLPSHSDLILVEGERWDVDACTRGITDGLDHHVVGSHDEGVVVLRDLQTLKSKLRLEWTVGILTSNKGRLPGWV